MKLIDLFITDGYDLFCVICGIIGIGLIIWVHQKGIY